MQENVNRRDGLKLAGAVAIGTALTSGSSLAQEPKTNPARTLTKELQKKHQDAPPLQGRLYTVGANADSGFFFSIYAKPNETVTIGIDPNGKHAAAAIQVVLTAFEKGSTLIVWVDPVKPQYAASVVAL